MSEFVDLFDFMNEDDGNYGPSAWEIEEERERREWREREARRRREELEERERWLRHQRDEQARKKMLQQEARRAERRKLPPENETDTGLEKYMQRREKLETEILEYLQDKQRGMAGFRWYSLVEKKIICEYICKYSIHYCECPEKPCNHRERNGYLCFNPYSKIFAKDSDLLLRFPDCPHRKSRYVKVNREYCNHLMSGDEIATRISQHQCDAAADKRIQELEQTVRELKEARQTKCKRRTKSK